jgi:hypothetical protein
VSKKLYDAEIPENTGQLTQEAVKQGGDGRLIAPALTRRSFFAKTSAVGAGLGFLAATGAPRQALAQSSNGVSAISSNFNGTAFSPGDWIWFTSVLKVHGLGSQAVTIGFMGSIQFSVNGTLYVIPAPSALVTFSPSVTLATTVLSSGMWITTVPLSGLAGNVFLDGVAAQAPTPAGLPGGIQPVTWQGAFFSMTPGLNVQWQWAAAVYMNSSFGANYNLLGVKPVDDNKASVYQNSDHAGTPENFEQYVVGGATGGGGSNFTGSYSGTEACTPAPACMMGGSC